jgi:hypothetical protein
VREAGNDSPVFKMVRFDFQLALLLNLGKYMAYFNLLQTSYHVGRQA